MKSGDTHGPFTVKGGPGLVLLCHKIYYLVSRDAVLSLTMEKYRH